jgi:hypothetical protein
MEAGLARDGDGDGVGNLVGTEDEAGGKDITGDRRLHHWQGHKRDLFKLAVAGATASGTL